MKKARLRVGDEVRIRWGTGYIEGTIGELYGLPGKPRAIVLVPVHDAWGELQEEQTYSFPISLLERVDRAAG